MQILERKVSYFDQISPDCVPVNPIENKSAVSGSGNSLAPHSLGDKPLPVPAITHFTDAYVHNMVSMS